ncbi:MAG: hypothetical protein GTO54_07415, partial [Nitrososphaeria archaeon]|nr:hypothetical protein [Nitrososphaeria archaeon]
KASKELPVLGPSSEWFTMFSDGKPIQMLIDNRYGTDFSMLIDELDTKTVLMRNLGNDLAEELKEMKAAGQFSETRGEGPTEEMQDFYEYVRGIFNSKNV